MKIAGLALAVVLAFGGCSKEPEPPPPPVAKTVDFYINNQAERDAAIARCRANPKAREDFDCQNALQAALVVNSRAGVGGVTFSGPGFSR
jgi:hypothetical protein